MAKNKECITIRESDYDALCYKFDKRFKHLDNSDKYRLHQSPIYWKKLKKYICKKLKVQDFEVLSYHSI